VEVFSGEAGDTPVTRPPRGYAGGGEARWLVLPEGPDAGRKLFFLDTGPGEREAATVLFVHGNPECSYGYRKVIAALRARSLPAGTRLVAMDHIGFGLSDQARYEMVDMHHARNLAQLVTALDLRKITLVVHDWGGPIGIGALLDTPDRVANLVVLNTTVFPIPPDGRTYENHPIPIVFPWARSAKVVPDRLWGVHSSFAVFSQRAGYAAMMWRYNRAMLSGMIGRLPSDDREARAVYRDQFASKANVRSSKRMVRQTPVWGHGYTYVDDRLGAQDNHAFYRSIQERIGPSWGPDGGDVGVAGLFGTWDPLGKQSVLDQWRAALPQIERRLSVFEGETHFIQERRPEEIAEAIIRLNAAGPA
jgi:pimeloyl-ACP methyl ester carboxylesterase